MKVMEKDFKIITELRNNARESLTRMSRKTGIPVSTIFDRIKVNNGNTILKHTSLLNFNELGYSARAKVTVKAEKESKEPLRNFLRVHPNVNSLYKINSGYDFLFELVFKNIKDLEEFMEQLDENYELIERNIYYIVDDIKREEFMTGN